MSLKRLKWVLFVWFLLAPATLPAQQNTRTEAPSSTSDAITIASEPDYPPYCLVDENGRPVGFSVDLFKAAAKAVGLDVTIKIGIWNRIKQDLANGKIDALPLVGRTPEREQLFDFTMPYLSLHGAVFVQKGTSGIHSLQDLKGKKIAVMEGDNAEEFVRREKISDRILTTRTFEDAFKELAAGKHDAVITQRVMGLELLKKLGIHSVIPLDILIPGFRQNFCFAVQKGNKDLLDRLNEGLSIVIANDTYEKIKLQWFGPDIKEKLSMRDVLKIVLYTLIPLILIMSVVSILVLRKEVKRQTKSLHGEIAQRKKTEKELLQLKNDLEIQVDERTMELQEKVQKLNNSQKAMLYMVEDLNRITAELKNERRKLKLSNEELEAFAYSVSHDLRAPLRAIDGFSQFLVEDYAEKLDDEGKRFIEIIRGNTAAMDGLISDLLDLSRVSRVEMNLEQMDMRAIAASMYQESATDEEKSVFELTLDKLPQVSGDVSLMKQVWRNLIGNALKYSAESPIKKISISAEASDKDAVFCIRDHGAGFDDRYVHKLFGVFQRLHKEEAFEGTGVGLAIVQRIIHRHGGRVWAEGKINEGAAFYFTLPRS